MGSGVVANAVNLGVGVDTMYASAPELLEAAGITDAPHESHQVVKSASEDRNLNVIPAEIKQSYIRTLGQIDSQNKILDQAVGVGPNSITDMLPVFSAGLLALSRVESDMQTHKHLPTARSKHTIAEALM